MEIRCSKNDLLTGLQIVLPAVSQKSSLPVLSNILFTVQDNGKVKLSSTDLEIGITTNINAEVIKSGGATIPAKRLADIVREVNSEDITISANQDANIEIHGGTSHFSIMGLPVEDFPVMPEFDKTDGSFTVSKELLKTMIRKTAFAVSYDETRYVLNGVFLEIEKGIINMVATDGRRLSLVTNSITSLDKKIKTAVIIPTKTINEIMKVLSLIENDSIEVGIKDNQIAFKFGENIMISRIIEGNFPNYDQVIPKKHDITITLPKDDFLSITRRVSLLATDKMNSVKYSFGKDKLKVSASTQGIGQAEDEMTINYAGPEINIAYNPSFIIDILRNIEDKDVNLEISSELNPGVIKPIEDRSHLCVVMPMKLQ
jgi:DNA polymerase III subunit beta